MKNFPFSILLISIAFGLLWPLASSSQVKAVQFEQLDGLQKLEKRPVVVFLHTSWCKYCGSMKNITLKNKEVAQILNDNFYFVSLDIEEKRDISFLENIFRYKPTGAGTGVHQLAEQLGTINGEIAFPGICFLNSAYEIIYQRGGYVPVKELLNILEKLKFSN